MIAEEILVLADLALEKIPVNTEFRVLGILQGILTNKQELYSPELLTKMNFILVSRSSSIRDFLKQQGYLKTIDPSTHLDILSDKGEIAKRENGHNGYIAFIEAQEREKNNSEKMLIEIQELTLTNLKWENENKELRKDLAEAQLALAKAQKADIPINAVDRKTNLIWAIAATIISLAELWLLILKW